MLLMLVVTKNVYAHASEQAFVLLLPTGVYITAGVLAVVFTIVLLAFLPARATHRLLSSFRLFRNSNRGANREDNRSADSGHENLNNFSNRFYAIDAVSVASTCLLAILLWLGVVGSHDPLENPLPLYIWTLWWIGFVIFQGIFGNVWRFVNPWSGVYRLLQRSPLSNLHRGRPQFVLPKKIGVWPGVVSLLLFMLFTLADIAPDAPARLALIVGAYWLYIFLGMCLFGERWLHQADCFTILLNRYAQLAFFYSQRDSEIDNTEPTSLNVGFPGWAALANPAVTVSGAVFILVLLGAGSFDGFNETFYWLDLIGINPLEFPGRSAVVMQTSVGLILANLTLIAIYGMCIYTGVMLANRRCKTDSRVSFKRVFCHLAIAILPIAFAYHFAHFLTAFLVNAQYALAAASDPLDNGADLLGLGTFYVTTGFMNSHHSVEAIWLTQAGAVVFGHVLSVLLAHALALDLFGGARRAIISQVPLALFMVAYTFIGLWLLAAPRGA